MSKLFADMKTEGLAESEDRLGGGTDPIPSNVYDATVKMAYAGEAQSGAKNMTIILETGGREVRETIYFTNRKGENFYLDKNDKTKKMPLPGFTTIDDLSLLTTGEEFTDLDFEEKIVNVYNFDERKEIPTPVMVPVAMLNQPIKAGILRVIEDKQKKNDAGVYVNSGESRTINTIDKFFHPETNRTVVEYRQEILTPEFHDAWLARNKDKDRNKFSGANAGGGAAGSGRPGMPGAGGSGAPKKKLFG